MNTLVRVLVFAGVMLVLWIGLPLWLWNIPLAGVFELMREGGISVMQGLLLVLSGPAAGFAAQMILGRALGRRRQRAKAEEEFR